MIIDDGQAFHAVYGSMCTTIGSRGRVNPEPADARRPWDALRNGDRVHMWGRWPGSWEGTVEECDRGAVRAL
jgi:hypothetical protein